MDFTAEANDLIGNRVLIKISSQLQTGYAGQKRRQSQNGENDRTDYYKGKCPRIGKGIAAFQNKEQNCQQNRADDGKIQIQRDFIL